MPVALPLCHLLHFRFGGARAWRTRAYAPVHAPAAFTDSPVRDSRGLLVLLSALRHGTRRFSLRFLPGGVQPFRCGALRDLSSRCLQQTADCRKCRRPGPVCVDLMHLGRVGGDFRVERSGQHRPWVSLLLPPPRSSAPQVRAKQYQRRQSLGVKSITAGGREAGTEL